MNHTYIAVHDHKHGQSTFLVRSTCPDAETVRAALIEYDPKTFEIDDEREFLSVTKVDDADTIDLGDLG